MSDPWAQEPPAIAAHMTEGHAGDSISRALAPLQQPDFDSESSLSEPQWRFQVSPKGDDFDDPTEGEFFTGEGLARALVRESIQNALDAAIDESQPVCVRFRLGETAADDVPDWLTSGLGEHLTESEGAENLLGQKCRWLLVEDFNCVGLSGDPEADYPENPGSGSGKNHYFYFWRNVGRTDKRSGERGSWGIGKAVFQSSSKVRSFFGLTIRHDDGVALLRGKSVLKTHHVDGTRFRPRGNFGQFSADPDEAQFALPVRSEEMLEAFSDIFDAQRSGRSGLSVLVPWLDEEVDDWTVDQIGKFVCEQYFLPIVAGQLVVEVSDGSKTLSIEREDISEVVANELAEVPMLDRLMMGEMITFSRWATSMPREDFHIIPAPVGGERWQKVEFDDATIEAVRASLDDGHPVAFRCGCAIRPKGGEVASVWFSVFLQRDSRLNRPLVTFVRRGITIPRVRSEAKGSIRALVVINSPLLGRLLGDAENPAHTDWEPRNSRVKDRWVTPEPPIAFVRTSVKELLLRLEAPSDELDEEVFADLFSFLQPVVEPEASTKDPDETGPIVDPPPATPQAFAIDPRDDGFVVRAKDGLRERDELRVKVAYAIRGGNAFSKWSPFDFDLVNSDHALTGAAVLEIAGNEMLLLVNDPETFRLEVSGFDQNRDLAIDVKQKASS